MIIDCHGHYTTARRAHGLAGGPAASVRGRPGPAAVPDDLRRRDPRDDRDGQLRLQASAAPTSRSSRPRASGWATTSATSTSAARWAEHCNDLVARVVQLYPDDFVGVCQLPQSPGVADRRTRSSSCAGASTSWASSAATSTPTRAAASGPRPPLTDRSWYPFYEAMVELDVPAMVHVSRVVQPALPRDGLVLPRRRHDRVHAAPARRISSRTSRTCGSSSRTAAARCRTTGAGSAGSPTCSNGRRSRTRVLGNVFFDTCVYHQPGIDLLLRRHRHRQHPVRVGDGRRGARDRPGDGALLRRHQALRRRAGPHAADRTKVFEGNARRVYARLSAALGARSVLAGHGRGADAGE